MSSVLLTLSLSLSLSAGHFGQDGPGSAVHGLMCVSNWWLCTCESVDLNNLRVWCGGLRGCACVCMCVRVYVRAWMWVRVYVRAWLCVVFSCVLSYVCHFCAYVLNV